MWKRDNSASLTNSLIVQVPKALPSSNRLSIFLFSSESHILKNSLSEAEGISNAFFNILEIEGFPKYVKLNFNSLPGFNKRSLSLIDEGIPSTLQDSPLYSLFKSNTIT